MIDLDPGNHGGKGKGEGEEKKEFKLGSLVREQTKGERGT